MIEELAKRLDYNKEDGVLYWSIPTCNSVKKGDRAGVKTKGRGYIRVRFQGKNYYGHRIAWLIHYGALPSHTIDHINGNTSDNRIINLRDVTHKTNMMNQKIKATNTSGRVGVTWCKSRSLWEVKIAVNGVTIHGGRFSDRGDADERASELYTTHGYHKNHGRLH